MRRYPKIFERIKELKKQLVLLSRGRDTNKRVAALRKRGKYYFMIQDYQNSLKDFNTAIQLKPKDHRLYYLRGELFVKMGKSRRAETDFIKTTDLNRKSEKGLNALGLLFMSQKKKENAVNCFNKAVTLNPRFSEGYNNLGLVELEITENYENSLKHFNTALSIDPKNHEVFVNRSRSYLFLGRFQDCFHDLTRALMILEDLLFSSESNFEEDPLGFNRLACKYQESLETLKFLNIAMSKTVFEKETSNGIVNIMSQKFHEDFDQFVGRKRKRNVDPTKNSNNNAEDELLNQYLDMDFVEMLSIKKKRKLD